MLCLTQAPTLMADAQQLLIGVESRGNEPCFWNGCYCVSSLGAVPLCVSFPAEMLAQVHKQMHYTVLYSMDIHVQSGLSSLHLVELWDLSTNIEIVQ